MFRAKQKNPPQNNPQNSNIQLKVSNPRHANTEKNTENLRERNDIEHEFQQNKVLSNTTNIPPNDDSTSSKASSPASSSGIPVQMKTLSKNFSKSKFYDATKLGWTDTRPQELKNTDNNIAKYEKLVDSTKGYYSEHNCSILKGFLDYTTENLVHYMMTSFDSFIDGNKNTQKRFDKIYNEETDKKGNKVEKGFLKYFQEESEAIENAKQNFKPKGKKEIILEEPVEVKALRVREEEKKRASEAKNKAFEGSNEITLSAEDAKDAMEKVFEPAEDTIGGDNRSGVADREEMTEKGGDNDNKQLNITADSMLLSKGLFSLGLGVRDLFASPSPENIVALIQSAGQTGEAISKLVSYGQYRGAEGDSDAKGNASQEAASVGSAFEAGNNFMSATKDTVELVLSFTKSSIEQKEKNALKSGPTEIKQAYGTLKTLYGVAKSAVSGAKAINEVGGGSASEGLKNWIPGLGMGISLSSMVMDAADAIHAHNRHKEMKQVKEEAGGKLSGKVQEDKKAELHNQGGIDGLIENEKDARAKLANSQSFHNQGNKTLDDYGAKSKDKQKTLDNREGSHKAVDILRQNLGDKEKAYENYGIQKDDDDLREYKLASFFKDKTGDDRLKSAASAFANAVKAAGDIVSLFGPGSIVGPMMKGVVTGTQLMIKGVQYVIDKGRDKAGNDAALKAIQIVQNAKGDDKSAKESITQKGNISGSIFNENKSSAAKTAEKQNVQVMIVQMLQKYPESIIQKQKTEGIESAQKEAETKGKSIKFFLDAAGINPERLGEIEDVNKRNKYLAQLLAEI